MGDIEIGKRQMGDSEKGWRQGMRWRLEGGRGERGSKKGGGG